MKIAVIGRVLANSQFRYTWEELKKRGYDVRMYSPVKFIYQGSESMELKDEGVLPLKCGKIFGKLFFYDIIFKLAEFKPDIVYFLEEPVEINSVFIGIISKIIGAKYCFITWENIWRKGVLRNIMNRISISLANHIFAGNEDAKNFMIKRGAKKEKTTKLVHTGIDTQKFRIKNNNEIRKITKDKIIIGYAGRIVEEKGIDDVIYALKKIKSKNIAFIAAGEGPYKDKIMNKCFYAGKIEHEKMPGFMNAINIFVYPSRTTGVWKEQWGYSIAEAMSSGKIVLVSDSGSMNEIVEDGKTGFFFKEGDIEDLKEKIEFIIKNKGKMERLKKNARDFIAKNYSIKKIADMHEEIFKKMLI